ncbi:ABC transporter permease [Dactylosporangium maewongense]|uniref:ABC transporter permease n=1 Tax=Dactylosporangium maewongense TaxID=634393 RepID=A0ABN2B4H9_9ACTN
MLGYLALETRRALRCRRYLLLAVALPAVLFLGYRLAVPFDGDAYLVPTLAALGAYIAATLPTARIALERAGGWQRQLSLTPLTPGAYLTAKALTAMLVSATPIAVVCLLARFVDQVDLAAGAWTRIVAGIWLATLPFALLGLVLGQLVAARDQPVVAGGALTVGALLGGLLVPLALFPGWLVDVAKALPTYWLGEVARSTVDQHTDARDAAMVLAAWTVEAAVVLAVHQWRTRRRRP